MGTNYQDMDQLPVYKDLLKTAKKPLDLTSPKASSRARLSSMVSHTASYRLLYATQRIEESTLGLLQQLVDQSQALAKFKMMKSGEIINRIEGFDSENRSVLHTASRDMFSAKPCNPTAARRALSELEKLERFLEELDSGILSNPNDEPFTDLINVGIGGSDLGPRAIYLALQAFRRNDRKVHFISNVDPDDATNVLNGLDLSRTLVTVVSKSGTTLETLTNEELVKQAFRKAGLDPRNHFIAVTGENSPMDNREKYLRSFYMFDYIGGRYSVTSMVGGVMLGFALGYANFTDFLKGANTIDKAAEENDIRKNIPLMQAVLGIWNRNFLGHHTLAILPYSQALIRFVAHLQQCDMESNGKSINRRGVPVGYQTGPVIWGEPGTNGQHAFYQMLHQGTTIVPAEFIGFRKSQYNQDITIDSTCSQEKLVANLLAQSIALAGGKESDNPNRNFTGNRPCSVLLADRLTPSTMGELLAIYETKIAFQGFIWNINSFDQEGVQLGKVLANRLLKIMAHPESPGDDPEGFNIIETSGFFEK